VHGILESPIPSHYLSVSPIMSLQLSPAVLAAILEAIDSPVPMVLLHRQRRVQRIGTLV